MKKQLNSKIILAVMIIAVLFLLNNFLTAQEFIVTKVTGSVQVQKGTSEGYTNVTTGIKLSGDDLLITDDRSLIQLQRGNEKFILNSNSALGLNYIKEVSINDLLLALALEEIRNVPKLRDKNTGSTAVYGTEEKQTRSQIIAASDLGIKKLNGAKQLAENGYKESAIIFAKETYRKYPQTQDQINYRLYFAELLEDLGLYQEALDELEQVKKNDLTSDENNSISKRLEEINSKIVSGQN